MSKIQELLNKEDRKTVFYNSYSMINRARIRDRANVARRRREAAAQRAAAAATVTRKAAAKRQAHNHSVQAQIGRYKGGSTVRSYDSSYHISGAKKSRRKARSAQKAKIIKRRPSRYRQLM